MLLKGSAIVTYSPPSQPSVQISQSLPLVSRPCDFRLARISFVLIPSYSLIIKHQTSIHFTIGTTKGTDENPPVIPLSKTLGDFIPVGLAREQLVRPDRAFPRTQPYLGDVGRVDELATAVDQRSGPADLLLAVSGQGDIGLARVLSAHAPFRLAVAHEEDARRAGVFVGHDGGFCASVLLYENRYLGWKRWRARYMYTLNPIEAVPDITQSLALRCSHWFITPFLH